MRGEDFSSERGEDALVALARTVIRNAPDAWRRFSAWVREAFACRQCGRPVSLWDRVCQHCGTGNPVKISISPHLMLTAVACEIVLLCLNLRLG